MQVVSMDADRNSVCKAQKMRLGGMRAVHVAAVRLHQRLLTRERLSLRAINCAVALALVALSGALLPDDRGCLSFAGTTLGFPARAHAGVSRGLSTSDSELRGWTPREDVLAAVESFDGIVTKSDVLSKGADAAGLEKELLTLARACGANLQVSARGEIVFRFPRKVREVLENENKALRHIQFRQKAMRWSTWAGRVAFGLSFLATVSVVYAAALLLISTTVSKNSSSSDDKNSVVSVDFLRYCFGSDFLDMFLPRPYGFYMRYSPVGHLYGLSVQPPPKMSFVESGFSFVFGDGDPNEQLLAQERWQLIAEVIANSGGAVVAEQLAPYLDRPPALSPTGEGVGGARGLDAAMLPVLLRFDGSPKVSDEGDIVYVFPGIQNQTAARRLAMQSMSEAELRQRLEGLSLNGGIPQSVTRVELEDAYCQALGRGRRQEDFLREAKVKFSEASPEQRFSWMAYGLFAFVGTLFIGSQISSGKAVALAKHFPIMKLVVRNYTLLFGYTAAFLGIPLLRRWWLNKQNLAIQQRNSWRERQAQRLAKPLDALKRRLEAASAFRRSEGDADAEMAANQLVYDSSAPPSKAWQQNEESALQSFDRKLGKPHAPR